MAILQRLFKIERSFPRHCHPSRVEMAQRPGQSVPAYAAQVLRRLTTSRRTLRRLRPIRLSMHAIERLPQRRIVNHNRRLPEQLLI